MDNKPCQSPKCTVCGIPHECDYEFLQRELKEAKKVLRFYANEMNYKGKPEYVDGGLDSIEPPDVFDDNGEKARAYLAGRRE